MTAPRALVLRAPGTNRDGDAAVALGLAGAAPKLALLDEVLADPRLLLDSQLLVVPGGFSFADALGAGRLLALELATRLGDQLTAFVDGGHPVIGICNGFQVLVRTGLLPGGGRRVALGPNRGSSTGGFVCEWVRLQPTSTRCVWTADLGGEIECPIAHGEGRFVADDDVLATLNAADQVAFRYVGHNPNGSIGDVAGICDTTGLVLGLMPHPENHVLARQHPRHGRGHGRGLALDLFRAGVAHASQT